MTDPTHIARVACDETTAKRLADLLAETLPADGVAVCAFANRAGQWFVEILFPHAPDEAGVRSALARIDAHAARALMFQELAPRNWVAESLAGLKPVEAGRFVVHGAHDRAHIARHRIGIEIEASLAFGTGHHGTTRGCLLALARVAKRWRHGSGQGAARRALDVGTGTGVLAIAAAKALHVPVLGSDIDPVAVRVARQNAQLNGTAPWVSVVHAAGVSSRAVRARAPYDLVFANILLLPIRRMAVPLARLIRPRARIVLSGLLASQANAAIAAYRAQGLSLECRIDLEGWITLVMRRGR